MLYLNSKANFYSFFLVFTKTKQTLGILYLVTSGNIFQKLYFCGNSVHSRQLKTRLGSGDEVSNFNIF